MTLEELRENRLYKGLTPKEQVFIEAYFVDGNLLEATEKAFNTKTKASARSLCHKVKNKPAIATIIAWLSSQQMTREEYLSFLQTAMYASKTSPAIRFEYARIYGIVAGWIKKDRVTGQPQPESEDKTEAIPEETVAPAPTPVVPEFDYDKY